VRAGGEAGEERLGRRRLAWLAGARLVLSLAILAALGFLEARGRGLATGAAGGVYATLAAAFLVSAVSGVLLRRRAPVAATAAGLVGLDLGIVSALVHFTGGPESLFISLYVLVVVYGALFFERRGALVAAALAAACFGAVLVAERTGLVAAYGPRPPDAVLGTLWSVHAAALGLTAFLAGFLSRDLRLAGLALDRSRRDLRQLRSLHAWTVESLLSGLLTTDLHGNVTSFNPEAERITGGRGADIIGRPLHIVLPGAEELLMAEVADAPESRPRARMPYRNLRGERLHLGLSASVLRDADGAPAGHVLIFQDVTAVVEMEQQLRRSERLAAVGGLAAAIAHEIRNPLASMSGSIQLLAHTLPDTSEDREAARLMEIVLRETDRLNALITDFLQYARPGPSKWERVELRPAVDETVEMLHKAEGERLRIGTEVPAGLAVQGDADQVRQLLWNLLLNAAQAIAGEGSIRVEARPAPAPPPQDAAPGDRIATEAAAQDGVELRVVDDGIGIEPGAMERIFDPFFTTKRAGTGLGLATVHRIVESHRGRLTLESVPGRGATFRIWLPRAEDPS